jgi:hypothetical protein
MEFALPPLPSAIVMMVGMLVCLHIGRRLGNRWIDRHPGAERHGFSVIDGAVFSLYGLLLAFTFSGAPTRLDARRHLIIDEANAIEAAYLRMDLLGPDTRPVLQEHMRRFVDLRLGGYAKLPDITAARADIAAADEILHQIWTETMDGCGRPGVNGDCYRLLLPSLNAVIDITASRTAASSIHPPVAIFVLLLLLAMVCSLLGGFNMAGSARPSWLHIGSYALIAAITIFTVLEIEYPRLGVLKIESNFDRVLIDMRSRMD